MPQKYGKNGRALHGFTPDETKLKKVAQHIDARRQKTADKARRAKFLAEPEELAVLTALETLPPKDRFHAAEGLLIARVARRKKFIK